MAMLASTVRPLSQCWLLNFMKIMNPSVFASSLKLQYPRILVRSAAATCLGVSLSLMSILEMMISWYIPQFAGADLGIDTEADADFTMRLR